MKTKLDRFWGSGPLQGTAAYLSLQEHGGIEVIVIAGDMDALQVYVTSLGLDPLEPECMEDVLVVEKRNVQGCRLLDNSVTAPGSGTTH